MQTKITFGMAVAVAAALLAGCSISTRVKPVADDTIANLCIKENPAVLMDGFLPELESQISGYGIATQRYTQTPPSDCVYRLEYSANWQWDLAMYLSYAELKVYKGPDLIGDAVYDARSGSANMDKFGTTADKLRTLTEPLFNRQPPAKSNGPSSS